MKYFLMVVDSPVPGAPLQHSVNINVIQNTGNIVQQHVSVLLLLELTTKEERLPEQDQQTDVPVLPRHLVTAQLNGFDQVTVRVDDRLLHEQLDILPAPGQVLLSSAGHDLTLATEDIIINHKKQRLT